MQIEDFDGTGAKPFTWIELRSDLDGRHDVSPFDDTIDLNGVAVPESTYELCFADASENGIPGGQYTNASQLTDAQFQHFPNVLVYAQHLPPSPPL